MHISQNSCVQKAEMGYSDGDIEVKAAGMVANSGPTEEASTKAELTNDEYHLAKLGYKQEFFRSLGLFENW